MSFTQLLRKVATGSSEPQSLCSINEEGALVGITSKLDTISVIHNGALVTIKRDQNSDAKIPKLFSKTSRPCPPFCVQPMKVAPDVETIGELEMLDYLQQARNGSTVVIDSRLKSWVDKGTIPGSVHIPWTSLIANEGATLEKVLKIITQYFSVKVIEGKNVGDIKEALENKQWGDVFDFSNAKVLVIFCNGSWCGQTSESIKSLLLLGYPAEKIKYYRDGMQGWVTLGLTTVVDKNVCEITNTKSLRVLFPASRGVKK